MNEVKVALIRGPEQGVDWVHQQRLNDLSPNKKHNGHRRAARITGERRRKVDEARERESQISSTGL